MDVVGAGKLDRPAERGSDRQALDHDHGHDEPDQGEPCEPGQDERDREKRERDERDRAGEPRSGECPRGRTFLV